MRARLLTVLLLCAAAPGMDTATASNLGTVLNANTFSGADIGAKVNAAISSFSGACGTVFIPAATYTQTTTIIKPRCMRLAGAGALSTVINYTGSGVALVVGDDTATTINNRGRHRTAYPEGTVEDLSVTGPGDETSTTGIYIGGDPASRVSPSTYYGDHVNFNRVRVWQFGTGVKWGNNSWDTVFSESLISNNGTGIYYPPGLRNSGESLSFFGTSIQNNSTIGINQAAFSDMYFYGLRCDYNATCGSVINAHFYGPHLEQGSGVFLTITSPSQPNVEIYGGTATLTSADGTDAHMFYVNSSSNPQFVLDGTQILSRHRLANIVSWNGSGGGNGVLRMNLPYHTAAVGADLDVPCTFLGCTIDDSAAGIHIYNGNFTVGEGLSIKDRGRCTMSDGTCAAQSLSHRYSSAPQCFVTWTGSGTLAGSIKVASTTTTVTPSSSNAADSAVVNWACLGN